MASSICLLMPSLANGKKYWKPYLGTAQIWWSRPRRL
uniref:Gl1 n=1 Tax=Arundo donax TaxID=35708 RepID=A0A0A9HPW8_ARUDO